MTSLPTELGRDVHDQFFFFFCGGRGRRSVSELPAHLCPLLTHLPEATFLYSLNFPEFASAWE